EAVDFQHVAAADERQVPLKDAGALRVRAEVLDDSLPALVALYHEAVALGAVRGRHDLLVAVVDDAHDLRDDVAGAQHFDLRPQLEAHLSDVGDVVEAGAGDVRPGEDHDVALRYRADLSGAPDLPLDFTQVCGAGSRLRLVANLPIGVLGCDAQLAAQGLAIDFDNHAVRLQREGLPHHTFPVAEF